MMVGSVVLDGVVFSELERLCRRHKVSRLELFGSALTGNFSDASDLDFLVEFTNVPAGEYAEAYFGLQEDLESLFGRRVDLVVASAVTNPYFKAALEKSKRLLYAA